MHRPQLSIVVPCYNEALSLETLHARVTAAAKAEVGEDYELVLINDGSKDSSWAMMQQLSAGDPRLVAWFGQFFRTYYSHGQIVRITLAALVYTLVLGAPLGNIVIFWAVPALGAVAQLFVFGTWLPHRDGDTPFPDRHRARSTVASLMS